MQYPSKLFAGCSNQFDLIIFSKLIKRRAINYRRQSTCGWVIQKDIRGFVGRPKLIFDEE